MVGFGVSLVTFSPNSTIRSADVNSNFQNLNNATDFQGNWDTGTSGVALWLSDEVVDSANTINMKPATSSPQRTVTIASRDGTGAFHSGLYVTSGASSGGDVVILQILHCRQQVQFVNGSTSGMTQVSGGGSGLINHNLGAVPTTFIISYAGNFGTAPTQDPAWYSPNSTQVTVAAQAGYNWNMFVYKP